jgi:hypothetical protein
VAGLLKKENRVCSEVLTEHMYMYDKIFRGVNRVLKHSYNAALYSQQPLIYLSLTMNANKAWRFVSTHS